MHKPSNKQIMTSLVEFSINCLAEFDLPDCYADLVNDSRLVKQGDIFCAVIGQSLDGRKYIEQAVKAGASLVISECKSLSEHGNVSYSDSTGSSTIAIVNFYQLNQKLFDLARAYYQNPQARMTMIGITGTNGKTSTSQLIAQLISDMPAQNKESIGVSCAVIGTNGAGNVDNLKELANTTPSASELHQLFYQFNQQSFSHIAMEVSSHALEQGRVNGDLFDIALFTNLSRDHLDYHGTMADYASEKRKLFVNNNKQVAIVNADDAQAKEWLKHWPTEQRLWLYSRNTDISKSKKFVTANKVKHHSQGVTFTLTTHLGEVTLESPLLGDFNIDNLLAAVSVMLVNSEPENKEILQFIANQVAKLNPIAGRMEAITEKDLPTAVVDYAHTPDALEKALIACKEHCQGELYVVFGCGGDRDKGKRPLMAQAAEEYADFLVITNDNPRTESAEQISKDILAGLVNVDNNRIQVLLEREQAVLATLNRAKAQDIVLLAGKGHEDYIILGSEKINYNEREVVRRFYQRNRTQPENLKGKLK